MCFGVKCSWDSAVSTVTKLNGLDDPGLESPQGKVIYFFRKTPRRLWVLLKPSSQWTW